MIEVPQKFRPHHPNAYPPDNHFIFEEWYFQHYNYHLTSERIYLPIFWTSYYVKHRYGKDLHSIFELQEFIKTLDPTKKYYTIIQFDDGILNDLSVLDCLVFGMSGKGADYNLPLICTPHRYDFGKFLVRDLFLNFVGRITHPIRQQMIDALPIKSNYYISTKPHRLQEYCRIIARSIFTLCPRGYGATSFRIQEALQYGSIPVYISDEHIFPHGISCAIPIMADEVDNLDTILKKAPLPEIRERLKDIYTDYFTYEANKKIIEKVINSSAIPRPARAS